MSNNIIANVVNDEISEMNGEQLDEKERSPADIQKELGRRTKASAERARGAEAYSQATKVSTGISEVKISRSTGTQTYLIRFIVKGTVLNLGQLGSQIRAQLEAMGSDLRVTSGGIKKPDAEAVALASGQEPQ